MKNIVKPKQSILSRLSRNAKISLRNASIISGHLKLKEITPENLLVGILLNRESLARRTIDAMNIVTDDILSKLLDGSNIDITKIGSRSRDIVLGEGVQDILRRAYDWSHRFSHVYVGTEHILLGILSSNIPLTKLLAKYGLNSKVFRKKLGEYAIYPIGILSRPNIRMNINGENDGIVENIGVDLVGLALEGKLDPVIGREEELDTVIKILSRRNKNNPLIIGEAGVGKTVLVEGLAQRIADGKVPQSLRDMRIVLLDIASIIAGSRMRGDVEEKMMAIVSEVVEDSNTILFIDEIHNILSSGIPGGSSDIASILKPALLKDDFRCIGATTTEEYSMYIEEDSALARRFQSVILEESSVKDTLEILKNIKVIFEAHHNININKEALVTAVKLSDRYVSDRYLPDKAIDLLDEACATKRIKIESGYQELSSLINKLRDIGKIKIKQITRGNMVKAAELNSEEKVLRKEIAKLEKECDESKKDIDNEVNVDDVREIVSKWTGIPLNTLGSKEKSSLLELENRLNGLVIGQNDAVDVVSNAIKRARTGISDEDRPWASFLFLGPSGVGKSELAKALTVELFGNKDRLVQIDMSEMMESHSVSKLIGSPPGYIGYKEGGRLTEVVRKYPHSVILFDEIEKAHPDVLNILLQILEYGHLTDGKGRTVNFKNTVVVLTSNIGAEEISKDKILGFVGSKGVRSDEDIDEAYDGMKDMLMSELKGTLRPELINRLDDVVIFRALNRRDARKIVKLLVGELNRRLLDQNIKVKLDRKLVTYIVKEGFSEEYGARPLRRLIQDTVENVLADYLLKNTVKNEKKIKQIKLGMEEDRVVVL
ncbi:TPA: ATP-dependent Clp protease ATP-binding subunit ClpC [Patescibacteria group bacterium]|nr:ATP-dependent Clp protease ATP-binding subunit ClpC [Patescibacteria group bacterium]